MRIVVAGDSHTQGVVDVEESYANLAMRRASSSSRWSFPPRWTSTSRTTASYLEASRRFVAAMQERGILCVDPTEAMRSADTPFYWRRDYHLNVAGHRLVAERLNEALVGRL